MSFVIKYILNNYQNNVKHIYLNNVRLEKNLLSIHFLKIYRNLIPLLRENVIKGMTILTADNKVILKSDNLYLPRLTKNGVAVYDSFRTSKFVNLYRNA
jgi:hypothetical protein